MRSRASVTEAYVSCVCEEMLLETCLSPLGCREEGTPELLDLSPDSSGYNKL